MSIHVLYKNKKYRTYFFSLAGGLFVMFFSIFYVTGLVPNELVGQPTIRNESIVPAPDSTPTTPDVSPASLVQTKPRKISIPSVGINVTVFHPTQPTVEVLDNALLKGAVYYPGSGSVENGNIFVFGHSTGLAVVQNQAFKAFNNLNKVVRGDEVYLTGDDGKTYVYKVISTELVNDDEALVSFDTTSRMITLSTCNTFGAKQERHVVKAIYDRELDS